MLTVSAKSLVNALRLLAKVVPSRTPKDILRSIRVDAGPDGVNLSATDCELSIVVTVQHESSTATQPFLIPLKALQSILKGAKGNVTIEPAADSVIVTVDGACQTIAVSPVAEWPDVPSIELRDDRWTAETAAFSRCLTSVRCACDVDSTRYALGGIILEHRSSLDGGRVYDGVTMAATDSRRLAAVECPIGLIGQPTLPESSPIVPAKSVDVILAALKYSGGKRIDWQTDANGVLFRAFNVAVYTRLVDGRFPKYRDVIPPTSAAMGTARICARPLADLAKRALQGCGEESRGADFHFETDRLTINVVDDGRKTSIVHPVEYCGPDYVITLDPAFLADFAESMPAADCLTLYLPREPKEHNANWTPVRIESADTGTVYIVMPLARDDEPATAAPEPSVASDSAPESSEPMLESVAEIRADGFCESWIETAALNNYGESVAANVVFNPTNGQRYYRCRKSVWTIANAAWSASRREFPSHPSPMPDGHCMFTNPLQYSCVPDGCTDARMIRAARRHHIVANLQSGGAWGAELFRSIAGLKQAARIVNDALAAAQPIEAPEPIDDAPAFNVTMALHVVADSWEQLRESDVFRLFDSSMPENRLAILAALDSARPDLAAGARGALAAICHLDAIAAQNLAKSVAA